MAVYTESCSAFSGYIYCIGGTTTAFATNGVYFAQISSNGWLYSWEGASSYPTEITQQSCAAYSGYIYCFGGDNGTAYTDSVYYAQILNSTTITTTSSSISTTTITSPTTVTSISTQRTTTTVTTPTTTTVTSTSISPTTITSTITSVSTATQTSTVTSTATTTSIQLVPTFTKIKCSPSTLSTGNSTTCTAKVTSSDDGKLPSKVSFSSSGTGSFGTVSCKETSNGTTCVVFYTPSKIGKQIITARYPGDQYHSLSSGKFTLNVTGSSGPLGPGLWLSAPVALLTLGTYVASPMLGIGAVAVLTLLRQRKMYLTPRWRA